MCHSILNRAQDLSSFLYCFRYLPTTNGAILCIATMRFLVWGFYRRENIFSSIFIKEKCLVAWLGFFLRITFLCNGWNGITLEYKYYITKRVRLLSHVYMCQCEETLFWATHTSLSMAYGLNKAALFPLPTHSGTFCVFSAFPPQSYTQPIFLFLFLLLLCPASFFGLFRM